MLESIIRYFATRHLLTNLIILLVFIGGVFSWQSTKKEEMPDITFDRVRITVVYPGAPAEDVEYFVTEPIEEEIRGLDGVYRITSNSSVGQSNITVELEQNYPDRDEVIVEIRNAVLDVDLPEEVVDDPRVRVFKTSKKAILDVALYHEGVHILNTDERQKLQEYSLALENQLTNLPQVNSVTKNGELQEEIRIEAYPERLLRYEIPFNTVMREIRDNHVRKPAGTVETIDEPKVTLLSELNTPEKLSDLVIQGGFEGRVIRLDEVADIQSTYERNKEILKVNGHEAIMFNVVKNSSSGILEGLEAVTKAVDRFRKDTLKGTPYQVVLLDDESIDIRNRLNLISINGAIGFLLILVMLFIFLNIRSGIWVALGIPFTLCFTMICAALMGYTINGTTLAAVIIVMGIVVDDAIVVAENITRMENKGLPHMEATVKGTSYVMLPIVASIVTTCVAFIPLFFFQGRFGAFIQFIPPIIFLMLGASLIESILILPGHMGFRIPIISRLKFFQKLYKKQTKPGHWFDKVEEKYGNFLISALKFKWLIFAAFLGLFILASYAVSTHMKFVMFPNEETRDIVLSGAGQDGTNRFDTADLTKKIEEILVPYIGKEVVGFRTEIARSRRGGAVEENKFRMIIEIVPKEKRKKSADALIKEFDAAFQKIEGFKFLRFQKSRWGQSSGSPIEIIVQHNNDEKRVEVVNELLNIMKEQKALKNAEIDEGYQVPEYRVDINREKIKRLSINPTDIASTFRAALEGTILFEFSNGDHEIDVRFTTIEDAKNDIEKVLSLPVENKGNYLVPLREVVSVKKVVSPNSIARRDLKRTTYLYADMYKESGKTPLEIAEYFEETIFPDIYSRYPTATLSFGGEVQDTRESKSDFKNAIIMVLFLVFIILAVLFNSLTKPLIIMLAIPFSVVGILLAFWVHGKILFGFYAAVGALGLAGVVINDSILMLVKLEDEFDSKKPKSELIPQIARISQTRLRAVVLTTVTTVAGVLPTAYGFAGYDAMLAEMMLALAWGMIFGSIITLILIPSVYLQLKKWTVR